MQSIRKYIHRKDAMLIVIILSLGIGIGLITGISYNVVAAREQIHLHGSVVITVKDPNGTVVSQVQNDTIYAVSYDYLICYLWNVGCSNVAGLDFPITTITTTATITSIMPFNTVWMGLGLSPTAQSVGSCTNIINANGLTPMVAGTTSHALGSNSILLSQTWTATGSQNVQAVCLLPATTSVFISAFSSTVTGTGTDFASENFSLQSLTNGQSITIQWTFSF